MVRFRLCLMAFVLLSAFYCRAEHSQCIEGGSNCDIHEHHQDHDSGLGDKHHNHNHGHDEGAGCIHGTHGDQASLSFVAECVAGVIEAVPWLLAGVLPVVAFQALPIPISFFQRHLTLQEDAAANTSSFGLMQACFRSAFLGLCVPLCSCGVLPMALIFQKAGVSAATITAFVTAAQSAGFDSFVTTVGVLGVVPAVARLAAAFFLAVSAGMAVGVRTTTTTTAHRLSTTATTITEKSVRDLSDGEGVRRSVRLRSKTEAKTEALHSTGGHDDVPAMCCAEDHPEESNRFSRAVTTVLDVWTDVVPLVVVGLVLTTVCMRYCRAPLANAHEALVSQIRALVGGESAMAEGALSLITRASILIAVLPLQLCEHSTASFASALIKAGSTQGTAFAFLALAPATNLATLGLLMPNRNEASGYNGGRLLRVALALVVASLLIGVTVDAVEMYGGLGPGLSAQAPGSAGLPPLFVRCAVPVAHSLTLLSALRFLRSHLGFSDRKVHAS